MLRLILLQSIHLSHSFMCKMFLIQSISSATRNSAGSKSILVGISTSYIIIFIASWQQAMSAKQHISQESRLPERAFAKAEKRFKLLTMSTTFLRNKYTGTHASYRLTAVLITAGPQIFVIFIFFPSRFLSILLCFALYCSQIQKIAGLTTTPAKEGFSQVTGVRLRQAPSELSQFKQE